MIDMAELKILDDVTNIANEFDVNTNKQRTAQLDERI